MKITIHGNDALPAPYVPPALGNGDLSLQIDREGSMTQQSYCDMTPGIRRAGYRYDGPTGNLIPFGYFTQSMTGLGDLAEWSQSLNLDDGVTETDCLYTDGTRIRSTVFCLLTRNIIVIRKSIQTSSDAPFELHYSFQPPRTAISPHSPAALAYDADGMKRYQGVIALSADAPAESTVSPDGIGLRTTERECTFFLSFDEESCGTFAALLAETRSAWTHFWQEGGIDIPSFQLQKTYRAALYHLRISSTRWSIPTGIFDAHWNGLYFGFDEYFNMMGLLTAGHIESALRVPLFRSGLLPSARSRSNSNKCDKGTALFPWETNEIGGENSPRGFWYDHIFHESHFALEAWMAYRFSGRRNLQEQAFYPLIRGCVEYLRIFHITYDAAGRRVIGACTDLERLGPAIYNPFMTSCSVIAALEAAANAADELRTEPDKAEQWRELAAQLRLSLPHENGRYRPYIGCGTQSIAQLSGIFPYGVTAADDPLQRNAVADYRQNRRICGNMYQLGSGICSWYQAWEAITVVRMRNRQDAVPLLEELADGCGNWGEMFEIREVGMRPYFTTAAGCFVQAVNELLLQFDGDTPVLAPAVPADWRDFGFKLPGLMGKTIEAQWRNGQLVHNTKEIQK